MNKKQATKFKKLFERYRNSQLCPNCKTGAENVKMFPDYCPYVDCLKIDENCTTVIIHKDGTSTTYRGYKCSHFVDNGKIQIIPNFKPGEKVSVTGGEFRFTGEKSEFPNPDYVPPASVKSDNVNHPEHYTTGKYECIDYIEDKLSPEEFRGYIKGNIIKYLTREKHKNGDEDILKAQFYLNRLCRNIKGDENK